MNRHRSVVTPGLLAGGVWFLFGCALFAPAPTAAPNPTPTPTRTSTATPTDTLTPTVTFTPTSTAKGGGGKIVYSVGRGSYTDVYLYDIAADEEIPLLVEDPGFKFFFSWSPDNTRIAAQEGFFPPDNRLIVIDAETGEKSILAQDADCQVWFPAWSPDGNRIAFSSDRDDPGGDMSLYTMDIDGTDWARLTDFNGSAPNWSPDGTQIAFQSNRDGNYEIYVMNADGSDPVRLTDSAADDRGPIWSPDGKQILFSSETDDNSEVFLMNADGTGLRNLSGDPAGDTADSWSPDGSYIVFESDREGDWVIFLLEVASGMVERIPTSTPAFSAWWSH
jgi:Tol biopolymer transport system component